jgi:hypothetical protein
MAAITTSALNGAGIDFERSYEEHVRSRQAALERQLMMASITPPLMIAKIPLPGRGYFSVEEMYAVPELAKTPKPLPPRANKRLLLCPP